MFLCAEIRNLGVLLALDNRQTAARLASVSNLFAFKVFVKKKSFSKNTLVNMLQMHFHRNRIINDD